MLRAKASELDPTTLFREIQDAPVSAKRRKIFAGMTAVDYYALDDIWLGRKAVPEEASASSLLSNLATLLAIRKRDAAAILGVSESRISRNDRIDVPMLDRAQGVSEVFAHVAAVLGPEGAQTWFKTPNPALEFEPPYRLLGTSYGERRVANLITALLNGAVV